jgi:hypothetical protein
MTRGATVAWASLDSARSGLSKIALATLASAGFSFAGGLYGAGAHATDPVSTFSECVYTQQQPIARRRIVSNFFLKVLKSASGRIHVWHITMAHVRTTSKWPPVETGGYSDFILLTNPYM